MNTSTIFTGIFFGAIGAGYFLYGKKEKKFSALFAGALLIVLPLTAKD